MNYIVQMQDGYDKKLKIKGQEVLAILRMPGTNYGKTATANW